MNEPTLDTLPDTLVATYKVRDDAQTEALCAHWNGIASRRDTCHPHGTDAPYVVTSVSKTNLDPFSAGSVIRVQMERVLNVEVTGFA